MKQQTLLVDQIESHKVQEKAKRLCEKYNCGLYDLIILSIDYHAEHSEENLNKESLHII